MQATTPIKQVYSRPLSPRFYGPSKEMIESKDSPISQDDVSLVTQEVELEQHIIRYMKALKLSDFNHLPNIFVSYKKSHKGESRLCFSARQENATDICHAFEQMEILVAGFYTDSFSLCHSSAVALKGLNNAEVVEALQRSGIKAGWHSNPTNEEVLICCDTKETAFAAFTAIDTLVQKHFRNARNESPSNNSPAPPVQKKAFLHLDIQRYLRASFGYQQQVEKTYHVKVEFDFVRKLVVVRGNKVKDVNKAIAQVRNDSARLYRIQLNVSAEFQTQLQLMNASNIIQELNAVSILAGWIVENLTLSICSDTATHAYQANHIITGCVIAQFGMQSGLSFMPGIASATQAALVQLQLARKTLHVHEESIRYVRTMLDELQLSLHVILFTDLTQQTLEVCSYEKNVAETSAKVVQEIIDHFCHQVFDISCVFLSCLKKLRSCEIIKVFQQVQLRVGWSVRENKLFLCSADKESVEGAFQALSNFILESQYPSKPWALPADCVNGPSFKRRLNRFVEDFEQRHYQSAIFFDTETLQMKFASLDRNVIDEVMKSLIDLFLDWTYEDDIKLASDEHVLLIQKNIEKINKMNEQYQGAGCKFELIGDSQRLHVSTKVSRADLAIAIDWLNSILQKISQRWVAVNSRALIRWVLSDEGKKQIDAIAEAHGTTYSLVLSEKDKELIVFEVYKAKEENKVAEIRSEEAKVVADLRKADLPIPSRLTLNFTGMTQEEVGAAVLALKGHLCSLLVKHTWTDSVLKNEIQHIPLRQIKEGICREVDVEIVITTDYIEIQGLAKDVEMVKSSIDSILHKLFSDQPVSIAAALAGADLNEAVLKTKNLTLKDNLQEYKMVERLFMETCGGANASILKIMKISNAFLEDQNSCYKSQVIQSCKGLLEMPVEHHLWHGTRATNLSNIKFVDWNFGRQHSNGNGAYFSSSSLEALVYSSKASAWEGFIFLARVVTGRPTTSLQAESVPKGYHSTVDSLSHPAGFTVYNLSAAYPEYLINCCWRGHI